MRVDIPNETGPRWAIYTCNWCYEEETSYSYETDIPDYWQSWGSGDAIHSCVRCTFLWKSVQP